MSEFIFTVKTGCGIIFKTTELEIAKKAKKYGYLLNCKKLIKEKNNDKRGS